MHLHLPSSRLLPDLLNHRGTEDTERSIFIPDMCASGPLAPACLHTFNLRPSYLPPSNPSPPHQSQFIVQAVEIERFVEHLGEAGNLRCLFEANMPEDALAPLNSGQGII